MRRKDKEMTNVSEIIEILEHCKYCRLAMADGDRPYVVPINFGYRYEGKALSVYFHGIGVGKKIEILKANPKACFEMDRDYGLIIEEEPCDYGYAFESVIGFGSVAFIEDPEEKARALDIIMQHQTGESGFTFPEDALRGTTVYKIVTEDFTGKRKLI